MKIAIVTGSYPPATCGIGDYTCRLVTALRQNGAEVEVICDDNWSIFNIGKVYSSIRAVHADIVHIQYPTAGFGKKLTPQVLSLAIPCIVTLHEVSEAHILRKLSLYPFSVRSKHMIFTTEHERDFAVHRAPWISHVASVIPIGSNVSISNRMQERSSDEIIYFGLFRPRKGLEEVLRLASLIVERSLPLRIRLIGKPFPKDSAYFKELYRQSAELPIIWNLDLNDDAVADLLSRASIAYMPFPDGASGRRGSLLALLANGVITISTRGAHTPSSLDHAVVFAQSPEDAVRCIEHIQSDAQFRARMIENGRMYASQFDWDHIALRHIELYKKLLE